MKPSWLYWGKPHGSMQTVSLIPFPLFSIKQRSKSGDSLKSYFNLQNKCELSEEPTSLHCPNTLGWQQRTFLWTTAPAVHFFLHIFQRVNAELKGCAVRKLKCQVCVSDGAQTLQKETWTRTVGRATATAQCAAAVPLNVKSLPAACFMTTH